MRISALILVFLFGALLCGQTPQEKPPAPAEKPELTEAQKKAKEAAEKAREAAFAAIRVEGEDRPLPRTRAEAEALLAKLKERLASLEKASAADGETHALLIAQRDLLQRLVTKLPASAELSIEKEVEAQAREAERAVRELTRKARAEEGLLKRFTEGRENALRYRKNLDEERGRLAKGRLTLQRIEETVAERESFEQEAHLEALEKQREGANAALLEAERTRAAEIENAKAERRLFLEEQVFNRRLELQELEFDLRRERAARTVGLAALRLQTARLERDYQKLHIEVLRNLVSQLQKQELEREASRRLEDLTTQRDIHRRSAQNSQLAKGARAIHQVRAIALDFRISAANLQREQQEWLGRIATAGDIGKAETASKALAQKIAASVLAEETGIPTTVGIPETAEELRALIAQAREHLERVAKARKELDKDALALDESAAAARRREESLLDEVNRWNDLIAERDNPLSQTAENPVDDLEIELSLLKGALSEFQAKVPGLHRHLDVVAGGILDNLGYLERELLWTRSESRISLSAIERAFRDVESLGASLTRHVAMRWGSLMKAFANGGLQILWAGLYVVILGLLGRLLHRRSLALPTIEVVEADEDWMRSGTIKLKRSISETSRILKRSLWSFLFVALLSGVAAIMRVPRAFLLEIVVVAGTPFAYRLLRLLIDSLCRPAGEEGGKRRLPLGDEAAELVHVMLLRLLFLTLLMVPIGVLLRAAHYEQLNPGFVELWWMSYRLLAYLMVLTTLVRPSFQRSIIRGKGEVASFAKALLLVALPFLVAGFVLLFVLEGLRYLEAARVFRIWMLKSALAALGVVIANRIVLRWLLGGRSPRRRLNRESHEGDETQWLQAGRRLAMDRLIQTALTVASIAAVLVAVTRMWPLERGGILDITLGGQGSLTVAELFLAVTVIIGTFVLLGHYRQLMEFFVLPATGLDRGLRYTVLTLSSYIFFAIGMVIALRILRISGNQIGWVVSALAVGIGFGLQSIVRNLVSGIILLVERPVRVGDLVQVSDDVGFVEKITIRATTVMTLDGVGVVIPNEELIGGRVVNNSLGAARFRVNVAFGVAYGSDVSLVRKVSLEVAQRNHRVLKRPQPQVLFQGFGDSSLDFSLQFWIHVDTVELVVCSDLRYALEAAFNRYGIAIPFPQRDLHLVSVSSQARRGLRGESEGEDEDGDEDPGGEE